MSTFQKVIREAKYRKRSSPQHKAIIERLGCAWVYIEGYPERIPRRFGDNMGSWPHRVKATTTGPQAAHQKTQYEDPLHERNVIMSWAVQSDAHGKRLERRIRAILEQMEVPLRGQWHDIEPDKMIEIVQWAATVEDLELMPEREYWALVDRLYDQRAKRRASA